MLSTRNLLLNSLSSDDLELLTRSLNLVKLPVRTNLEQPNRPINAVYFVEEGIASVVAASATRREVEVGLIGCEGMSGLPLLMSNDRSPNHTYMQIEGSAHRISASNFAEALATSNSLHAVLLKYAYGFLVLSTQTAVANGRGRLEERLARWLLMAQDRLRSNQLPLTHDFIALMLGVRRASVTTTLQKLKERRLIDHGRGVITVQDRSGLEAASNGFYGIPEKELKRLLGKADDNRRSAAVPAANAARIST